MNERDEKYIFIIIMEQHVHCYIIIFRPSSEVMNEEEPR